MKWAPVDVVVLVLAITVSLSVAVASVYFAWVDEPKVDIDTFANILAGMLAIVSVYVGHAMRPATENIEDKS